MKLFEGKTKSERNKTIAAIGLGAACLIVLFFAFGRGMFSGSSSTTVTAKPSPSPKRTTAQSNPGKVQMPSVQDQMLDMTTQPVVYNPSLFGSPDAGRNIFAFYEPPKPTPYEPTPAPPMPIITPPPPTPHPILIAGINPQSAYAGSNGFRMEIAGDRFSPDTKIYFEQQEIPATFINETRMTADIPNALIRSDGRRSVIAQTTDGTKTSNPIQFDIQPPPRPAFQYIGMIARKRSNNDTAYFQEQGKQIPTSARLNDVVGGRFRLVSISGEETVLEDVNLGFKHKLQLESAPPPSASQGPPVRPGMGQPGRGVPGRQVYTPSNPPPASAPGAGAANTRTIPVVPSNIPRYMPPPNSNTTPKPEKQDGNDEDDGID